MQHTRRTFLTSAAAASVAGNPASAAESNLRAAHEEIWRRFIDPKHGTFYDYVTPEGAIDKPVPEDCRSDKPNALGWSSPIENGAFFGGLYLDALTNAGLKNRAATIAGGLVKLASVGGTPGFVARGVATDGETHWAASSSDQTFPWFYGLWRYSSSGLPGSAERRRIQSLLERVILAIEKNEWRMPCDRPGFGFFGRWQGGFAGTKGILTGAEPDFDAAARLLLVHRAMHQMTGEKRWLTGYRRLLKEAASDSSRTRLEVCGDGVAYVPPGTPARFPASPAIWTSASSQAGLRALWEMEDDPGVKAVFARGLSANASRVSPYIAQALQYDNDNPPPCSADWRRINELWKPQASIEDAVVVGNNQKPLWRAISPRLQVEADQMRDPLFAAWIVSLSGDRRIIDAAKPDITRALGHFRWNRLFTAKFFMAECVYHQLRKTRT